MSNSNSAKAPSLEVDPRDETLICFCHGVPESEIKAAIKAGARTLEDVKRVTKASTGCGGCTSECERLLSEQGDETRS